jgi:hypothetical protein
VLFGLGRLVAGTATGIDHGSAYNLFVGATRVASGFATVRVTGEQGAGPVVDGTVSFTDGREGIAALSRPKIGTAPASPAGAAPS